jgi:predicted kinase
LLALAGEAGSGKSTLSRALGCRLRWPVIDKDDIKDILYGRAPDSGPLAYEVMFNVARRQLLLGLSVICDSPLTGRIAYDRAAGIAAETGASLAVVKCRCPDESVWRERINARKDMHLPAHHQTDWEAMQAQPHRLDSTRRAQITGHPYLLVETMAPVELLCDQVIAWLAGL